MLSRLTAALFLFAATASLSAQVETLPRLGDSVPTEIVKARSMGRTCETGDGHREPCAEVHLGRERVSVAWNPSTQLVTYLYSKTIITDSELSSGNVTRNLGATPQTPFLDGIVSLQWCDTERSFTGKSLWCAIMKPAALDQVKVLGFVQSVYLHLPPRKDTQPASASASQNKETSPKLNQE